jgi:hypothetical protein
MHQILPHEEELKKNCGRIVEIFSEGTRAKSFYNNSTILPQFFPATPAGRGSAKSFHNFSTILPCRQFTLVRKQRFYGNFVEIGACQIREGFSLLRLTRILRVKAGKCVLGIIVEKS